ncbi:hypothetical protein [Saccharolobus islandicus]|uniref:hypothetical protein n=1 Tax=Saccharolobus islandicus TaxID=43080 RepID=UPI00064EACC7|nr:hypothetical protein [Sulfolobus islandicus]
MNLQSKIYKYDLIIDDVSCEKCVNRINSLLTKMFNILDIAVNLQHESKKAHYTILSKKSKINIGKLNRVMVNASNGTPHNYRIINFKESEL